MKIVIFINGRPACVELDARALVNVIACSPGQDVDLAAGDLVTVRAVDEVTGVFLDSMFTHA